MPYLHGAVGLRYSTPPACVVDIVGLLFRRSCSAWLAVGLFIASTVYACLVGASVVVAGVAELQRGEGRFRCVEDCYVSLLRLVATPLQVARCPLGAQVDNTVAIKLREKLETSAVAAAAIIPGETVPGRHLSTNPTY